MLSFVDDELYVATEGCKHGSRWEKRQPYRGICGGVESQKKRYSLQRRGQVSRRDQTRRDRVLRVAQERRRYYGMVDVSFPRSKSVSASPTKKQTPTAPKLFWRRGVAVGFRRHPIRVEGLDWHCAAGCLSTKGNGDDIRYSTFPPCPL